MNKQEQNTAIARACGWLLIQRCPTAIGHDTNDVLLMGVKGDTYELLPDYTNDLNAMHEAESTLDAKQLQQMAAMLFADVDGPRFHATASQRAEAFLNTISS